MEYYLAIDIGASSGRHILGYMENNELIHEEIHRFPNNLVEKNGSLCWDLDAIFEEILKGLTTCKDLGKIPVSVGIDTWGVDFVLLDKAGDILGDTVSYRDDRTSGMDEEVYKLMSEVELYKRTGIPRQMYNTIFQLMAVKKTGLLEKAKTMLMLPDYLHYRLSGVAKTEYTIATTTGLLNAHTRMWDDDIISACGYPRDMFMEIVKPGTCLGGFTSEVKERVGFDSKVVMPASHDTGSAVMAVPSENRDMLFISSGTWSVIGVERESPDCSVESMESMFGNEGCVGGRIRYLKNNMGLWMIQSIRKEMNDQYTYAQLCELAEKESISSIVECNNDRFFAPESMTVQVKEACVESGQQVPDSPGELAAVVYNSLAVSYRDAVRKLEQMTGTEYPVVYVIGGGSNAMYLNDLTAQYTGKTVHIGPVEATAIGNILSQSKHNME